MPVNAVLLVLLFASPPVLAPHTRDKTHTVATLQYNVYCTTCLSSFLTPAASASRTSASNRCSHFSSSCFEKQVNVRCSSSYSCSASSSRSFLKRTVSSAMPARRFSTRTSVLTMSRLWYPVRLSKNAFSPFLTPFMPFLPQIPDPFVTLFPCYFSFPASFISVQVCN